MVLNHPLHLKQWISIKTKKLRPNQFFGTWNIWATRTYHFTILKYVQLLHCNTEGRLHPFVNTTYNVIHHIPKKMSIRKYQDSTNCSLYQSYICYIFTCLRIIVLNKFDSRLACPINFYIWRPSYCIRWTYIQEGCNSNIYGYDTWSCITNYKGNYNLQRHQN